MNIPELLVILATWSVGALVCAACALAFLRRAQLPRPPLGVFDSSDLVVLYTGLAILPLLYIVLPSLVLTVLLAMMLVNILYVGLRPLFSAPVTWLLALLLVAISTVVTLAVNAGWQAGVTLHWVTNDLLVLMVVVTAANLYVQWGMCLRVVAWFVLVLACYDALFAWGIPLTPLLASHFAGAFFEPLFGFTVNGYSGYVGMGDLFAFSLFTCAAYKGYGRQGAVAAFGLIAIAGILLPAFGLPVVAWLIGRHSALVPVQVTFGPAAWLVAHWLMRHAPERSVLQWRSAQQAG